MTDYFETLSCSANGSASFTTQVNKVLDAVATGVATKVAQPTHVFSVVATSVPKLLKLPTRILSTVGTSVPKLLKLPGKLFLTVRSHTVWFFAERFGASAYDVLEASRKWFETDVGKWSMNVVQRFLISVRGRI